MTDFAKTRAALAEYDSTRMARDSAWLAVSDSTTLAAACEGDRVAKAKVTAAFAADTEGVNGYDHAALVHPDDPWLRLLVTKGVAP